MKDLKGFVGGDNNDEDDSDKENNFLGERKTCGLNSPAIDYP